jgi:hypothetical protein
MKFECDGIFYDSDEMLQPRIEDKYIIALFLTPDHTRVFGTYMNPGTGVVVRRIQGDGLELLARRINAPPELLKAIDLERNGPTS